MKNQIEVDLYNDRIVAYFPLARKEELAQLVQLQQQHQPSKTIVYVTKEYVDHFVQQGYESEGQIPGFFYGFDSYIVSQYKGKERKTSKQVREQADIMSTVQQTKNRIVLSPLEGQYSLHLASHNDVKGLVQLYRKVFEKYPTMIFDQDYVGKMMTDDYFFVVIKDQNKIVSAASAMINEYKSAEITDCATDPDYRGKQFLLHIITRLEKELFNRGVYCAYSLTRALSPGMNVTIKRLGYEYGGKLVNNCIISTGFEDMCIWSKQLNQKSKGADSRI
ncbi:putative beta-lysine N-acetyltransferase [Alkalihalobacterium chitinilyticum]|uniref:Beta-lysine N-acetyltransferase n=1 Tax=Alkalihalobacterium chitinilyticum TaxID=2980103 RepID=A0ABT5VBF0_9BACI|nr:putative beta-lysine N-acetyltransferase [Alkalihalobacterium chitinilyticum]MDE5412796.1 putative beta-lysine N-acetyltransferase [Alkalihalobacterium chitinilyticum]